MGGNLYAGNFPTMPLPTPPTTCQLESKIHTCVIDRTVLTEARHLPPSPAHATATGRAVHIQSDHVTAHSHQLVFGHSHVAGTQAFVYNTSQLVINKKISQKTYGKLLTGNAIPVYVVFSGDTKNLNSKFLPDKYSRN